MRLPLRFWLRQRPVQKSAAHQRGLPFLRSLVHRHFLDGQQVHPVPLGDGSFGGDILGGKRSLGLVGRIVLASNNQVQLIPRFDPNRKPGVDALLGALAVT